MPPAALALVLTAALLHALWNIAAVDGWVNPIAVRILGALWITAGVTGLTLG